MMKLPVRPARVKLRIPPGGHWDGAGLETTRGGPVEHDRIRAMTSGRG